ncbi:MAG: hypothetical protein HYX87_07010 [Chloroflexi bacterium]|nr:hypothetical protein [Chloroflexota bacterium]
MEIWHRVAFNAGKGEFLRALEQRGVKYKVAPLPGTTVGMVYFDMSESDPRWPKVDELIQKHGASNVFDTIFTPQEIVQAEWSRLTLVFEQGYPQPKEGWEELTLENGCSECGAGYRQKAPFRINGEPRLGKNDFMCLYWVWTAFCTKAVLSRIGGIGCLGYEAWVPLINRTGEPSKVISQIVCQTVAAPALVEQDKLRPETCMRCGITKYGYHKRGYMRMVRDSLPVGIDFVQTHEWFGSGGHAAFREILVSNREAQLIVESGWRGVRLKPIQLV